MYNTLDKNAINNTAVYNPLIPYTWIYKYGSYNLGQAGWDMKWH